MYKKKTLLTNNH